MSSKGPNLTCQLEYTKRLAEICGSSQPSAVARKLHISYQAAKNYLGGRLPDSSVLLMIAEHTPYSVHWLLTGRGEKIIEGFSVSAPNAFLSAEQIRQLVREEMRRIFSGALNEQPVAEKETEVGTVS